MTVEQTTLMNELEKKLSRFIQEEQLNVYDISVLSDRGSFSMYLQPCNACNENYSMTKFFITTMIGILVDRGLLSVDERITDLLRDELPAAFDPRWEKVTVEHCLTHRSGLARGALDIDRDRMSAYATDDYLALILSEDLTYEPGTEWVYTDCVHYLLSRVISKLTGEPADRAITREILNPLHFDQASFAHCPRFYTIGSSGSYMKAGDTVKMAELYRQYGIFEGKRILSEEWVRRAEERCYDLYRIDDTDFFGKGGMCGQMLMYSRARGLSVSWHSYEPDGRAALLETFFSQLLPFEA